MVATLTYTTITLVAITWFELFDTQEIKFEIANLKKDILWLCNHLRNETAFILNWVQVTVGQSKESASLTAALRAQLFGTPPLSLSHFTLFIFNLYPDNHFWIRHV